jgi:hypothetical protein
MIDYVIRYLERGLRVVPVRHMGKVPAVRNWQNLAVTKDNVTDHFGGGPHNIGVLLGKPSSFLADVDLDSELAIRLAPYFLPKTGSVFGRFSRPRSHYQYRLEKEVYRKFLSPQQNGTPAPPGNHGDCLVELRGKSGLQTVYPGSVHESGEPIEWAVDGDPGHAMADELEQAVIRLAIGALIVPLWRQGVRNYLTLALSGCLVQYGFPLEDTDYLIKVIRKTAKDEEDRSGAVRSTYQRAKRQDPVLSSRKLADLTSPSVVTTLNQWIGRSIISSPIDAKEKTTPAPLKVVRLSEVKALKVRWLWPGMIPKGFFTLAEGPEGVGKTFAMLKLAQITASGGVFPGGSDADRAQPGNVLLLSAEDSAAYLLKPRLEAMGAPCERIFALDEPFTLDERGFGRLTSLFEEQSFDFVLFDPLFSFTGLINLNNDSEIRRVTDRLNRLAERYDTAIVGIRHIGKSKGQGDPRNAGLNGVGWRAGARSSLLIGHDPDDKSKRAIVRTKSNLCAESEMSYGYEIDSSGIFTFTGKSGLTADRMLSFKENISVEEHSKVAEGVAFLEDYLRDGAKPSLAVYKEGKRIGISGRTLERAKSALKVESRKDGIGKWVWALPGEGRQNSKDHREVRQVRSDGEIRPLVGDTGISHSHVPEVRQTGLNGDVHGFAGGRAYTKCPKCGREGYVGSPCPYCRWSPGH